MNHLNITTDHLPGPWTASRQIELSVLRLDQLHPVVSGNKMFKLHYYMQSAKAQPQCTVITFGGAYSNHLVATAYACNVEKIPCIGIVRGEQPAALSHTLQQCLAYGMQLQFISRQQYDAKDQPAFLRDLNEQVPNNIIVPEGGFAAAGAMGASEIMQFISSDITHICCAVGTATTLAGLLMRLAPSQRLIGFAALKGMTDIEDRVMQLTSDKANLQQLKLQTDYHFGGYAKHTPELILHMNELWHQYHLPTDFVYTAKMLYGVLDLIRQDYFSPGSKIMCIHTGGLQGNLSLPKTTLTF